MFKKVYAFEKWQKCQIYKGQGSKKYGAMISRRAHDQGSESLFGDLVATVSFIKSLFISHHTYVISRVSFGA